MVAARIAIQGSVRGAALSLDRALLNDLRQVKQTTAIKFARAGLVDAAGMAVAASSGPTRTRDVRRSRT